MEAGPTLPVKSVPSLKAWGRVPQPQHLPLSRQPLVEATMFSTHTAPSVPTPCLSPWMADGSVRISSPCLSQATPACAPVITEPLTLPWLSLSHDSSPSNGSLQPGCTPIILAAHTAQVTKGKEVNSLTQLAAAENQLKAYTRELARVLSPLPAPVPPPEWESNPVPTNFQ